MEPQLGLHGERRDVDDEDADAEAQVQQIVWAVAGLFVAASVVSSVRLIRGHLNHFTQPNVQSKVEREEHDWSCWSCVSYSLSI